ncbi:hypothetical protein F5883DRAFT_438498, partial [Diaporthe sp. PMI_573]
DLPELLKKGAKKYPNLLYIITYGRYKYVIFPSSCFNKVKRLNTSQASTIDWFN